MFKQRYALVLLFILPLVNAQSVSEALVPRWVHSVGIAKTTYIEGVPITTEPTGNIIFLRAEDINNDGFGEIVAVTGGSLLTGDLEKNNVVFAYRNDGTLLWKVGIDDLVHTAFLKDIDRDGYMEILVGSGRLIQEIGIGRVSVIDSSGNVMRKLSSSTIMESLYIADLDNDRYDEVIGGSSLKVHVFDSYGTKKWSYLIGTAANVVLAEDIYGDSNKEILVGADNLYIFNATGGVEIWYDIAKLTGYSNEGVDKITLADIAPLGQRELLLTTDKSSVLYAFVLQYNESTKFYQLDTAWYYPVGERITTLTTQNIDDDEYDEILLGSADDLLHVLDNDGSLLWTYMMNGDVTGIKVADLDNDTFYEVIASTTGGSIFVLNRDDGSFKWRYDIEEGIGSLDVRNLEDDNLMEIIVGSLQRNVYVFELNVTFTELQLADSFYFKAQQRYLLSDYNFSLLYLQTAREIYKKYGDGEGLKKADSLITIIEEKLIGTRRKQADIYYEKAQEAFISGDYEQSREFANMAKEIYAEFGEPQNILKCELLLRRIDAFAPEETTIPTTIQQEDVPVMKKVMRILPVIVVLLVLIFIAIFLIRRKRKAEAMEKDMEEYEKDLEKVIDEDIEALGE